jgi:hypothetical protein
MTAKKDPRNEAAIGHAQTQAEGIVHNILRNGLPSDFPWPKSSTTWQLAQCAVVALTEAGLLKPFGPDCFTAHELGRRLLEMPDEPVTMTVPPVDGWAGYNAPVRVVRRGEHGTKVELRQ